jgi:hypothetical protein
MTAPTSTAFRYDPLPSELQGILRLEGDLLD